MKHQSALNNMIVRHRSSRFRKVWLLFVLPAACQCYGIASAQTASFQGLGFLPGGNYSQANGVSADGSTVVGMGVNPLYTSISQHEAWRWTSSSGMVGLGTLSGGAESTAFGASGDGSVVVGAGSSSLAPAQAFRWTRSTGIVGLGLLPAGSTSQANGVSGDGSAVVGIGISNTGQNRAWRWTSAGGMVSLGILPGGGESGALGVSGNGSVVVGNSSSSLSSSEAFRWTSGSGMVGLGLPPGGSTGQGNGVSADGLTIVGYGLNSSNNNEAWEWTSDAGFVGLGFLPGLSASSALAASGDAGVIVGWGSDGSTYQAAIWDAFNGLRSLQGVLTNTYGLNLTGWTLQQATGISADGGAIVGYGIDPSGHTEAWLARLPVSPATLLAFSFTNVVQTCKTKVKIDKKTVTTNMTTTCKLSLQLVATNIGIADSAAFNVLVWAGQGSNFNASAGLPPANLKVKALKSNNLANIKLKDTFDSNQTGTFIYCTDTDNNILTSTQIE